jgi:spermidine synthase
VNLALYAAFFVSGAAALLFEVVWTRLLLIQFGATSLAVAVVLGAFMGGMAVGSALAPRLLLGRRDPVRTYALLEIGVGLYGLATPALIGLVSAGPPAVRFAACLLVLLPATAAMGASLPVLAGAILGHGAAGSLLGRLYAVNTAGAVAGPLLAVFLLFPGLGLARALFVAALADLVAGGALLVWRWVRPPVPAAFTAAPRDATVQAVPRALLVAVGVSGAAAMVYEVAWSRTLSLVFGSSVYAVSITLSTFLLGLALGSALASAALRRFPGLKPESACRVLLAGSAAAAFASLLVAKGLPAWFLGLYRSLPGAGGAPFAAQTAVAMALMIPAALCLGAMLPVAAASLTGVPAAVARSVAWLYTANLVGATVGTLLAAGLMLGSIGIEASVRAASVAALLVAMALFLRPPRRPVVAIVALVAAAVAAGADTRWDPLARSFGLYAQAATYTGRDAAELRRLLSSYRQLFYRDGPTATVSVQEVDQYRLLKINGKTDASNGPGDLKTQLLLAHLPLMAKDARRVAVIGWGSGMTVGAVLAHPVESVDAFEIEPAVVEASRFFEPENRLPLQDARVKLILGDARANLRGRGPYDLIISEPSNPWLTGVANLFTANFFTRLASRLTPDGVVCQWFHLYGMSEEGARSLLATFRSVFPHTIVFGERDLLLLGSRRPIRFDLARMQAQMSNRGVATSLARTRVQFPFDLLVEMRLDEPGAEAFARGAPLNTDDNMRLELMAPRTLYGDHLAAIHAAMQRHPPALAPSVAGYGSLAQLDLERAASLFTRGRAAEALAACRESLEKETSFEGKKLLGQILGEMGRTDEARTALREALALDADPGARAFVQALLETLPGAKTVTPPTRS